MLVIQNVLISSDIVTENFFCNLNACKGACCTEGDYGAPVDELEMETIRRYMDSIIHNLPDRSKVYFETSDGFKYYEEPGVWGTDCHPNGACVFLTTGEDGIAVCGIEKTWYENKIAFQKPISCHLYPIRISTNDIVSFEAWNYDKWDICAAACTKGNQEKMPLYKFVKDAIIRKKGKDFYDELVAAVQHMNENDSY